MVKLVHKWVEIEQKTMVFQPCTLEIPFFFNTFNVPICLKLMSYLLHENYSDCSPKVML